MKKILVAAAAASLLLSAGSALAKSKSYVISLGDPFCVVANVTVTGQQLAANENDACQTFIGGGFVGSVKRVGRKAIIGGISSAIPGAEIVISLDYPFVTGGNYTVYGTSDGKSLNAVGSGTYTVE